MFERVSERNSAVTLESMIKEILQEAHDDQQNQCDNVNLAFEKKNWGNWKGQKEIRRSFFKGNYNKTSHNLF